MVTTVLAFCVGRFSFSLHPSLALPLSLLPTPVQKQVSVILSSVLDFSYDYLIIMALSFSVFVRRHSEDLWRVVAARRAVQDAAVVDGGHNGRGHQGGHGEVWPGEGGPGAVLPCRGQLSPLPPSRQLRISGLLICYGVVGQTF